MLTKKHSIRLIPFPGWWLPLPSLLLIGAFAVDANGQDPVETGRRALRDAHLPWYDETMDSDQAIDTPVSARASSINRANVPPHIPPPVPNTNFNWLTNFFAGNFWGLSIFSWIIIGIAVVATFGLLVWAGSKMEIIQRRSAKSQQEVVEDEKDRAERIKELPFQVETRKGDISDQAKAAYEQGDYRQAMTLLFSHVLLSLDRRHLIRLRRGKTNRQYLRELKPHEALADFYRQVMVPFEETFFGDHLLEKRVFESCWSQLDGFQTAVQQSSEFNAE